jgi:DNA-binding MurR/RpiR family transcriptional regulator
MKQIFCKRPWQTPASLTRESPIDLRGLLELRLTEARGALSANDERIAAFLREHLDELAFRTADSLAQGAGVSAAAVVRFAHRLGFESFRELRDLARAELREAEPSDAGTPAATGARSVLNRKVEIDVANLQMLPHALGERLEPAAEAIGAAEATYLLAGRETYGLAVYAYRLLHQARPEVELVDPGFPDALRTGVGAAVVAISFRPYARQTIDLISYARSAGARVILVTDGLSHDFIEPSDIVLAVPVESPGLFLSFTAAVCVLESLANLVANIDADRTYEALEATAKIVESQNLLLEPYTRPHYLQPPG